MWHRIKWWTTPKQKNEYNYGWEAIKRGPIWHTKDMWFPFVAGAVVGLMMGLLI